jgi:hypothetical protein
MKELVAFNVLCAIIAAKWSADAGMSQFRQLLFGVAAIALGPLILLVLYVRYLYQAKKVGSPAAKWI